MPQYAQNHHGFSIDRAVQKLIAQRGAGARQSVWLLRDFRRAANGQQRTTLKEVWGAVAEAFGVSDGHARRWCEGVLAHPRYLEEMRARWGIAFILHLYADDAGADPTVDQALALLRRLSTQRDRLQTAPRAEIGAQLIRHPITDARIKRIEASMTEACRWLAARHQPTSPVTLQPDLEGAA